MIKIADEIGLEAGAGIGVGLIVLLSLIQVSKLQINPWTMVGRVITCPFKALGRAMTADLTVRIDQLSSDVRIVSERVKQVNDELETFKHESAVAQAKDEEDKIVQKRADIIRFGDDIRSQRPRSIEHFNNILDSITEYERYCETHPMFENSKAVSTIQFIKADYERRLKTNDFL